MIFAMLMVLTLSACCFGVGSLGAASGCRASSRTLRVQAAKSMVLGWYSAEHADPRHSATAVFSAALSHADRLTDGQALQVAADHLLAVRMMHEAMSLWQGGLRAVPRRPYESVPASEGEAGTRL